MKKLLRLLVALFFGIAVFIFVKQKTAVAPTDDMVGMPNPASVFCIENGGMLSIVESAEGQMGMCTFSDGTLCEERSFYRGECGKNDILIVDDFESCVQSGYPVMESYPRQCSADGKLYIEEIQEDDDIIICTMEYAPVCALITLDNGEQVEQTFGNACQMSIDTTALFIYDGECENN